MDNRREDKKRHLLEAKFMGIITVSKGTRDIGEREKKKQPTKPQNQNIFLVFSGRMLPEWLPGNILASFGEILLNSSFC